MNAKKEIRKTKSGSKLIETEFKLKKKAKEELKKNPKTMIKFDKLYKEFTNDLGVIVGKHKKVLVKPNSK